MQDGLKQGEKKADWFNNTGSIFGHSVLSGGHILVNGSITASAGLVMTGSLYGLSAVSGTSLFLAGSAQAQSRGITIGNIGSPAAVSNPYIQAGSTVTSAGSIAWVTLPDPFSGTNYYVTFGLRGTANVAISNVNGSQVAGSFFVLSLGGASQVFDWIAFGTKA